MSKPVERITDYWQLSMRTDRFRRSHFFDCTFTPDAVYGVYSNRIYPLAVGDDAIANYWRLRRGAALYDVPEHPVEIRGPDAERLLNKVFVRDITKMREGRALYAIACQPDGGVLMDGVLMRLGSERFWYVMADGEFMTWLIAHGMGLDVTITDPDSSVIQIQGPRSLEVLEAACDGHAPEPFSFFAVDECQMAGQRLLVSRTGWTGERGFELYTLDKDPDGPALWNHLLTAGEPYDMVGTGLDSMGIRRTEAGILNNRTDMDETMTPFHAGLGRFVDMDKPDFIGKQALENSDQRPLLYGVRCDSAEPRVWTIAYRGGKAVGRLTATAWSPFLGAGIGYIRFKEAGDWLGSEVSVTCRHGPTQTAEVVSLPFYDEEKRISRGLDTTIPEIKGGGAPPVSAATS